MLENGFYTKMHIGTQKLTTMESSNKLQESGVIGQDSGFLSGAITTESDLGASACDLEASCSSSKSFHRRDSGLDMSDHFSQLNISTEEPKTLIPSATKLRDSNEYPPWEPFFTPDEDGDTQLHIAIMQGNTEAAFTLISIVPHPSILDFQNDDCQTALHLAVLTKQSRVTRRLVAAGARVDMRDREGNCPLHIAALQGDIDCVQALSMALSATELEQCHLRYPPFAQTLPQQLDSSNYEGQAPIHLASMGGHSDVIRALQWLGADVHTTENKAGRSAVHLAAERGHVAAVRVLISECGCALESETYAGYTPFQVASETNPRIAHELRRLGAIPLSVQMDDSDSDSDVP
ncbi:unnamed protein product [Allacma fusca]|uniref:NF-kappa-B inhibitor cactus n=1 Tax=Allacma fusca TaxID=39272 RepID=A0A8J2LRH5_9HEXA|nr:unnamed protein product [Allacma fusca]